MRLITERATEPSHALALWTVRDFRLPRPSLAQSVWPLGGVPLRMVCRRFACIPRGSFSVPSRGDFFASACSEQALEIAAFCPRVSFAEGAVAAGFGTVVPVVVGGARTQPAPAPMMAADTAMIGSSFMDFSRRGEDQLLTAIRANAPRGRSFRRVSGYEFYR